MKKTISLLKQVVPWAVAALIFAYLFSKYQPSQLWAAVKHVHIGYFVAIAVVYFIILYIIDCKTIAMILARFGYKIPLKDIYPARGVTYLIMIINYAASQAAFAYYLKRTHKVPIFEVLGVFFFIALLDLYALITFALIGSFFQDAVVRGVDIGRYIQIFVVISYAAFLIHLLFWRRLKIFPWVRDKKIFHVFREATLKDYGKIALCRSPIHILIVFFLYIAVQTFDAYIPLATVISSIPIAFLIGAIPITPAGLGTSNVAMVELLNSHVSGPIIEKGIVTASELILALTLLWVVANSVLKAAVGGISLMRVSSQLFKPTEGVDPAEIESKATHLRGEN